MSTVTIGGTIHFGREGRGARKVIHKGAAPVVERVCPFCGSERIECRELPRERPAPELCDTS